MVQNIMDRLTATYEDRCEQFQLKNRKFNLQYFAFYNARYRMMLDMVKEAAIKKWGSDKEMIKLSQLMDKQGKEVIVIGTLLKVMKQQPSVLREVSDDLELIPEPAKDCYVEDADYLTLQDDTESCILMGNDVLSTGSHVTGVVMAVFGKEQDNGNRFVVQDFTYAIPPPMTIPPTITSDKYVLLVSGLGFTVKQNDLEGSMARDSLMDFIKGSYDHPQSNAIVRIIIAGNILSADTREQEKKATTNEKEDEWNRKEKAYTIESLKEVDKWLSQLASIVGVDVMPGMHDATSVLMPQQPIHPALLPNSCHLSSLNCTTNPYAATIDGHLFMGSSGRPIDSIKQLSTIDEPINALGQTLAWRHLAPTAPDSVYSYPFPDSDPFIINHMPHVYFAGNQKAFNTKVVETSTGGKTRLICVPSFKETRTCVLINLKDLSCQVVSFDS